VGITTCGDRGGDLDDQAAQSGTVVAIGRNRSARSYFDAEAYPYLLEFTTEHVMRSDDDFGKEFGYGLTVILDGLATSLAMDGGPVAGSPASRSTLAKL